MGKKRNRGRNKKNVEEEKVDLKDQKNWKENWKKQEAKTPKENAIKSYYTNKENADSELEELKKISKEINEMKLTQAQKETDPLYKKYIRKAEDINARKARWEELQNSAREDIKFILKKEMKLAVEEKEKLGKYVESTELYRQVQIELDKTKVDNITVRLTEIETEKKDIQIKQDKLKDLGLNYKIEENNEELEMLEGEQKKLTEEKEALNSSIKLNSLKEKELEKKYKESVKKIKDIKEEGKKYEIDPSELEIENKTQQQPQQNQSPTQQSQPQPNQSPTQPGQQQPQPNQSPTQQSQPQIQPNQPQTQPSQPKTQPGQPQTQPNQPQSQEDEDVVFNDGGKDNKGKKIKEIRIDAYSKNAIIYIEPNDEKISYNIDETLSKRKEPQYKDNINKMLDSIGTKSPIKRALFRRKINPIIVRAISNDKNLMMKYAKALRDKTEFPFKYYINLDDSFLSTKDFNLMNRIALKEAQIKGNKVKGAKKKFTKIKNAFAKIKNTKLFSKKEKTKELTEGKNTPNPDTKSRKKIFDDRIKMTDEKIKEFEEKTNQAMEDAYKNLTDEEKKELPNKSLSEIQIMSNIDYNVAFSLKKKYGNKEQQNSEKGTEQKQNTQRETEDNEEKGEEH